MDQQETSELNTGNNNRLLNRYGIVPSRGKLLHHQLERMKYFDSGDFSPHASLEIF
ncbi:hypothetical protein DER46DRAFT_582124 [Fusarium sp. MPI-SDFR-AT-0072]|uniref:uncharacterized protein n=1 Tax=Fusarium oxysporum Fo47 TaxID=660027 RepID=UPI002869BF4D|nr:uncharacterized protein FOBCDRAFT_227360 [Fusarium oxysporum Fo47]KAH7180245.1 hypothetical protein DER46DRAFT_582124 [Fusarium sp. MPI-SDFR-AT-0072]WJG35672.1 hypothetical protein FOBCDRAFT_227360 [Fusarium oxysporum Fo47]